MFDSRPQAQEEHLEPPPSMPSFGPQSHVTAVTFGSNNHSPAGEQEEEFISQLQPGDCEI